MTEDPFSGDVKPIKGVRGLLRRRIGDYRISFTVNFEKNEVVVLKIGRRESFYS
jgi:mRNA-degrading endonuclease RelE of RelBE toxin-antitoxin system